MCTRFVSFERLGSTPGVALHFVCGIVLRITPYAYRDRMGFTAAAFVCNIGPRVENRYSVVLTLGNHEEAVVITIDFAFDRVMPRTR